MNSPKEVVPLSTVLTERVTGKTMPLDALAQELLRQQATKRDYVVDTRRMSFVTEGGQSFLTFDSGDPRDEGTGGGPLNNHAHSQVGDRIGVPRAYYRRMFEKAPELLDRNVQHWLHNEPEKRMVRMLDGNVRAFLSDRYRRLDNVDLLEKAILPVFREIDGLEFQVSALTPERLYIRALLPNLEREVKVGDIVQAGVQIRNSEVGSGALEVAPILWRLICLNGMVVPDSAIKSRHVGRRVEEDAVAGLFSSETIAADDQALFLKVRDVVKASLDEVRFDAIVSQLQESVSGRTIEQIPAATESLASTLSLTGDETSTLLTQLATGGDLTQWGAANAVTATAKSAEDFTRQEELERLGWEVATMGTRDWERVALARS